MDNFTLTMLNNYNRIVDKREDDYKRLNSVGIIDWYVMCSDDKSKRILAKLVLEQIIKEIEHGKIRERAKETFNKIKI